MRPEQGLHFPLQKHQKHQKHQKKIQKKVFYISDPRFLTLKEPGGGRREAFHLERRPQLLPVNDQSPQLCFKGVPACEGGNRNARLGLIQESQGRLLGLLLVFRVLTWKRGECVGRIYELVGCPKVGYSRSICLSVWKQLGSLGIVRFVRDVVKRAAMAKVYGTRKKHSLQLITPA